MTVFSNPAWALVLLWALVGSVLAAPAATRVGTSAASYPPTQTSTGFTLVLNITNPKTSAAKSLQHQYVTSIHTGAGEALVGFIKDVNSARIFYQNGTAEQHKQGKTDVLTDGGTPTFPSGISLVANSSEPDIYTANLNAGAGTAGVRLPSANNTLEFLLPKTYMACEEPLAYYGGKKFWILKRSESGEIPTNCYAAQLLPQCAKLAALAKGSISSHKYVGNSYCYKDVATVAWGKYKSA